MVSFLEFEKPIAELEARIVELRATASVGDINIDGEIGTLEQRAAKLLADTYAKLTPWQKTQVARHPDRPHFKDYVAGMFDNFMPLAGDRAFADDRAILGGFATLGERKVMVIGHEKGDDTASRVRHNFGMAKPEGYRKARRLMQLADRFDFREFHDQFLALGSIPIALSRWEMTGLDDEMEKLWQEAKQRKLTKGET